MAIQVPIITAMYCFYRHIALFQQSPFFSIKCLMKSGIKGNKAIAKKGEFIEFDLAYRLVSISIGRGVSMNEKCHR